MISMAKDYRPPSRMGRGEAVLQVLASVGAFLVVCGGLALVVYLSVTGRAGW